MPGKKIGALSFYRVIVVVQYSLITKHIFNKEKIAAENLLKRLQTVQMDRDIKIYDCFDIFVAKIPCRTLN
jgi:hypothetical protein